MASEMAKAVAKEVLETMGKGKKPSVSKIAPKHGYKQSTADSGEIQQTKTYKETVNPILNMLIEERLAIMERLKVTRDKAKYRDLMDGLDKTTKNIQLLSGGMTENLSIIANL